MFLAVTARRCEISCPRRVELCLRVKFYLKFCFTKNGKNIDKSFCNEVNVDQKL